MIRYEAPTDTAVITAVADLALSGHVTLWAANYELCSDLLDSRIAATDGVRIRDPASTPGASHTKWRVGVVTSAVGGAGINHIDHPFPADETWLPASSVVVCRACVSDWVRTCRPDTGETSVRVMIDHIAYGPPRWYASADDLWAAVATVD